MINVLGPRPRSVWSDMEKRAGRGFAGQPFGNAGIQYGLEALKHGLITPEQFVDLNAKIGGGDIDLNPTPERLPPATTRAVANAYRTGVINEMTQPRPAWRSSTTPGPTPASRTTTRTPGGSATASTAPRATTTTRSCGSARRR